MITTKGRLLPGLCLEFTQNEIRISGLRLEEGEELAILIDQYYSSARIYAPFVECQRLASLHQYELVIRRHDDETFVSHLERDRRRGNGPGNIWQQDGELGTQGILAPGNEGVPDTSPKLPATD